LIAQAGRPVIYFSNHAGASGVVFVDANGVRRLNVLVGPEKDTRIERFGSDGKPTLNWNLDAAVR
jgi:hypothetical protein